MPRRAGEAKPELVQLPAGATVTPSTGCQHADTCPAQGLGHWLRYTDKSGERTVKHEADGSFWNRSCPVAGCTMRVFG